MALGSLALPDTNVGFDAEGTAMVPVSAGRSKLGEIKIKSPLDTFKDTFFSMQESLAAMLGIQTKEAKRQAAIDEKLLAQKDFEIRKMNEKFAEENRQGPLRPTSDDFKGVDTDKKRTNIEAFEGSALAGILGTLQESFDRVSFGEKMMAVILTGGLALFTKFREPLTKALTPIVQFVMDLVDSFGPGAVFAGFIGVMLAFKTGLAQFLLKFAAGGIIKGIALLGTKIKAAGGLMFLAGKGAGKLGDGIKAMNSGLKTVVSKIGSAGSLITKGLTKGFTMLGTGLKSLQIGIMSMSSSLGAMLVPFLPVIAIAAAAVAVFVSLNTGICNKEDFQFEIRNMIPILFIHNLIDNFDSLFLVIKFFKLIIEQSQIDLTNKQVIDVFKNIATTIKRNFSKQKSILDKYHAEQSQLIITQQSNIADLYGIVKQKF